MTGAAGFLGSNLVDLLLGRNDDVVGIDNLVTGHRINLLSASRSPHFHFRCADLTRANHLPRCEQYYHLASPASPFAYQHDPIGTLAVNSIGTHRVLEAARRADARVLLASTSEVYGDPEVHPQSEAYWGRVNPVGVRSCYDEGKRYAEALAVAYRRRHGLDVRIARIFNTYGPRMDLDDGRVISSFIAQGLRGRPFTIHGMGTQTRSFCYISDLIFGIQLLMDASPAPPSPMNLGNPREITVRRAAELVARALGVPARFEFRPLPADDPARRSPDIRLARRYIGWSPRVSFERGLSASVAYYRSMDELRPGTL